MKNLVIITMLILLFVAGCKKQNEDQLPPATQTGANTFGCLVNGKVFVPKGYGSTGRSNPHVQFEQDLNGQPYLTIRSAHFKNSHSQAGVDIGFNNLNSIGFYELGSKFSIHFDWLEVINNCGNYSWNPNVYFTGGGYISRLDIPNGIISGTFDCKFKNPNCDTVYITDGRFDIKF